VQINGENVLGVTHEQAVSLLKGQPDIKIVVQRDIASPASSPDRSSFSGSSPQHVPAEKPQSPTRSGENAAPTGSPAVINFSYFDSFGILRSRSGNFFSIFCAI